jgi:hypothetical protein
MGTKMHRGSNKRAALIGAAALPAIAGLSASLMSSSAANAAITFSVTNQGVASDGSGHTTTGYTGFLLTFIADAGDKITGVDFGTGTASTNGIFGPLIQDYFSNSVQGSTPLSQFQNGQGPVDPNFGQVGGGIDSHFLGTPDGSDFAEKTAPFENNNRVNPGGTPPNGGTNFYGTGTFMHGVYGVQGSFQLNSYPTAYVVLKDGTSATFAASMAEAGGTFQLAGTIGGGGTTTTPPSNKIVSLTTVAGAPTTYGNKLTNGSGVDKATFNPNAPVADSINVTNTGGPNNYLPGFANNINTGTGENKFNVQASGFLAPDQEVYALNIKVGGADPTAAQDATIIADINANNTGVTASTVTGQFATLFPGYDILLTGSPNSSTASLGLDFTQETNVAGVTVADVAAVPEPASAAGILLGATGLLLGRRKRNA